HHETVLAYCREFGITLTEFANVNEAAYVLRGGRAKRRLGEAQADLRGYTAELLAKVVRKNGLDVPLTPEDREKLIDYLRAEGNLNTDLSYRGHGDSNYPAPPHDLEAILKASLPGELSSGRNFGEQRSMLTPVGGMDRIAFAFAERLGGVLHYGALVKEIRRNAAGEAVVRYTETGSGNSATRELTGDFCICALPPVVLAKIPADFS